MLLCRPGARLSAAAPVHTNKPAGWFLARVRARDTQDVALTLRGAFQGYRQLTAAASNSGRVCSGRRALPLLVWDSPPGPGLADWTRWRRSPAASLSTALTGEPSANVLFSGHSGLLTRRCSTGTRAMLSRSASTSSRGAGEADGKTTEPEPEGGKPSKTQQLKKVFKEYGAVGVSFHICISLMSLGMFYLLVSSGVDMAAVLCKVGFSEAVVRSKMAAGTSTFVLAYAIHKLFAPARISVTLVSVPLIVRYLRKTGLFKPRTPSP